MLDVYVPVAERKSQPLDVNQEETDKVSGDTPSRRTFHERQQEAWRKTTVWIKEKCCYVGAMGASAAAVAHVRQ